jgi:hypothetical protein
MVSGGMKGVTQAPSHREAKPIGFRLFFSVLSVSVWFPSLLDDLGDDAGADGAAALADGDTTSHTPRRYGLFLVAYLEKRSRLV